MRRTVQILCLLFLPAVSGCALSDLFFTLFGDSYSGGGHTSNTRYDDYERRVHAVSAPPSVPGTSTSPF